MWDPTVYRRFGAERSRPFADLLAQLHAERPRAVVDLGCGPGNLTVTLAERWPQARVMGLDSAPEMIARARSGIAGPDASPELVGRAAGLDASPERVGRAAGLDPSPERVGRAAGLDASPESVGRAAGPDPSSQKVAGARGGAVDFRVGDVRDWVPGPDVDVLVSNATLQWVPEHPALLTRWARELPRGAWLAVQVPGNFGAASHRALRAVARSAEFAAVTGDLVRDEPVSDAAGYADLLAGAGATVDAWETTYVHLLPAGGAEHPVLRWMEGTALRPIRAVLEDDGWRRFRVALGERLTAAYPVRHGLVSFPFRRIFIVARTARPDE